MRALVLVSCVALLAFAVLFVDIPQAVAVSTATVRSHLRMRRALAAQSARVAAAVRTRGRDTESDADADELETEHSTGVEAEVEADADAEADVDVDFEDADALELAADADAEAEDATAQALERLDAATDALRARVLLQRGPKPRRSGGGGGGQPQPQPKPRAPQYQATPQPPRPKPQPQRPQPEDAPAPTLRERAERAKELLEGVVQKAVDSPMMRGARAKLEEVLNDPRTQRLIEGGTFAKQVKDDVIDPAKEGYKAWQAAQKAKAAGGQAAAAAATAEKAAESGAAAAGFGGKIKAVKDFMSKHGDALGAFTEAAKFGAAVLSGDREEMMKQSASAAGGAMKALKVPGADFVSASGELVNAADKFARGDAAGGSQAAGRGVEDVMKAGLNKAGPAGVAVATAITVTEGAMGVANILAPGLNARTNVGEVAGEAAYIASQKGVGQFGRDLAKELANDQRANSDNVVVKAAGVASQTLGKAMQTVDMGAQIVSAVADKAACQAQAAIPCTICAPWDGDCRAHMFDCRTKC